MGYFNSVISVFNWINLIGRLPFENEITHIWLIFLNISMFSVISVLFVKLKRKFKCWSSSFYGLNSNFTSKLLHDILWNIKPQTNTVNIHLIWVLDISKHLEKFNLIFFFYANSSVNNRQFKNLISINLRLGNYTFDYDFTLLSEFERIRL